MASKTIMIQEETYRKLAELRRGNESFNDLIQRLIYNYQDLTPYFGIISGKDGDQIEKAIEEAREANDAADLFRGEGT
ncbi:MAG: antitoxin VapB family protein [Candidatus Sigynarchaeota archaeon]